MKKLLAMDDYGDQVNKYMVDSFYEYKPPMSKFPNVTWGPATDTELRMAEEEWKALQYENLDYVAKTATYNDFYLYLCRILEENAKDPTSIHVSVFVANYNQLIEN